MGTYRHRSKKYSGRYAGECSGRHSIRKPDTIDQMSSVARNMIGKLLKYWELAV